MQWNEPAGEAIDTDGGTGPGKGARRSERAPAQPAEADDRVGHEDLVTVLRAAGEPSRIRILALLAAAELTVKDLTVVLGQSQPRISRHLKLLVEAGLVTRSAEGAFAYYRFVDEGAKARAARALIALIDPLDPAHVRDRERLERVRQTNASHAQAYFAANAAEWDRIRSLHVPEAAVEAAIRDLVGDRPVRTLLDVGTGTGRMLTLLSDLYERALGVDQSAPMLSVARANLMRDRISHARVAQGDIYALSEAGVAYDLVVIHQVLHYLEDPARAVQEAARTLAPGGRLLVVDFAPHGLEELRRDFAHRRLGFEAGEVEDWLEGAGLVPLARRGLSPEPGSEGQLTVTLWLGADPRAADHPPARTRISNVPGRTAADEAALTET